MSRFPADSNSRRTETRSYAILFYQLNHNNWEFSYTTGRDIGIDCFISLSQKNKWTGKTIKFQVKGTGSISRYEIGDGTIISYPFDVKTINIGLSTPSPFLLVVVDTVLENAYFIEVHEHFLSNTELFAKLDASQKTVSLHIPKINLFATSDDKLQALAFSVYVREGDGKVSRIGRS